MIKTLEIKNLKSIKQMRIQCAEVNLFIGTNSSGKSTIIQGILLAAQNMEKKCGLNGGLISMGTFEENRCIYALDKVIGVKIADDKNEVDVMVLQTESETTALNIEYKPENDGNTLCNNLNYKNRMLQYLSCHRVGPMNVYSKNMALEDSIGTSGQFAIAYLNKHSSDVLEQGLCKGNLDYTLLGQVNWWLSYIANTEISTEEIWGADLIKASYSMYDLNKIRLTSIGSGISYLISLLIVCLSSPKGSVIVMENPEIHLHPSAQAKLCEFFYFISMNQRQLFIESHSDHIFNGFRAGLAIGQMKKEKINIQNKKT